MLRDHGQSRKYYHDVEGYNGRLDTIQAGILHAKLKKLAGWNEKRRALAKEYARLFEGVSEVGLPHEPAWSKAVYHLYVVRVQNREKLQADPSQQPVMVTAIHFRSLLHLQEGLSGSGLQGGRLPGGQRVAPEIVSLPMFPPAQLLTQARTVAEKVTRSTGTRRPVEDTAGQAATDEALPHRPIL